VSYIKSLHPKPLKNVTMDEDDFIDRKGKNIMLNQIQRSFTHKTKEDNDIKDMMRKSMMRDKVKQHYSIRMNSVAENMLIKTTNADHIRQQKDLLYKQLEDNEVTFVQKMIDNKEQLELKNILSQQYTATRKHSIQIGKRMMNLVKLVKAEVGDLKSDKN